MSSQSPAIQSPYLSTTHTLQESEQHPSNNHLIIAQLHYENAQLKDEHEQMCSMLLDIAYHPTTPKQQRGEIILFLSLFDSGRTAIDKRQRSLDEQGRSQDVLRRIAKVRDTVEDLAALAIDDEITGQRRVVRVAIPKQYSPAPTMHVQITQPNTHIN